MENLVKHRKVLKYYAVVEISTVFGTYLIFDLDFKNAEKGPEKVFCFLDNYISIGCIKLSLLRREYLSLVFNVSTNSPTILHMTRRGFQFNFLNNDQ